MAECSAPPSGNRTKKKHHHLCIVNDEIRYIDGDVGLVDGNGGCIVAPVDTLLSR